MAEDNVDTLTVILRQLFEVRGVEPELLAEAVGWTPPEAVEPGTRQGADSFNRATASVFAARDDARFDVERVIDNGDDVVALGLMHGRIHGPGMEVDNPHGKIWTFRAGRVTRMRWFNTHAETLGGRRASRPWRSPRRSAAVSLSGIGHRSATCPLRGHLVCVSWAGSSHAAIKLPPAA